MKGSIILKYYAFVILCLAGQFLSAQAPANKRTSQNISILDGRYENLNIFEKLNLPVWLTSGNRDTDPKINFLGTIDNQALAFRTKNAERMRIEAKGNIGIGTSNPNSSAILDIRSVTQGVLLPRMTQAQRDAISSPTRGLLIYQTNGTAGFYYYQEGWKAISSSGSGFANRRLSNLLDPVEINVDLRPGNTNERNLGAPDKEWKNLYLSGDVFKGTQRYISFKEVANSFFGMNAGFSNTSGSFNTAIGYTALFSNTTGYSNTVTGGAALNNNTTGYENTASGTNALFSNTTGFLNTADGFRTLFGNTTGSQNTAVGSFALFSNRTGFSNTATGHRAMAFNTTGFLNTAIGISALVDNTTGSANTAAGGGALYHNITGHDNSALGNGALHFNTTGWGNTAVGSSALSSTTITNDNTAIGSAAAIFTVNPTQGTFIGVSSQALDNLSNITAIGYNALVTASNQVRIGNTSVTSIGGQVSWTNFSDGRYKKNVREDVPGLEFINKLRPVTYNLDVESLDKALEKENAGSKTTAVPSATSPSSINQGNQGLNAFISTQLQMETKRRSEPSPVEVNSKQIKSKVTYTGFVAQEVEKAANELGYNFSGVDAPKNEQDFYGLRYSEFVVPLVVALKELSKKTDALEKENIELKNRLDKLEALINSNSSSTNKSLITSLQLEQNIPNPFARTTTISYAIPAGIQKAEILISDYGGKMIRRIPISNIGKGTVQVDASSLANGMYNYTIVCDGKAIETKKMTVLK